MLLYYKQEDLEKLMTSLSRVHLSSSVPNAKAWVPSSRIFSVKSFLLALTILSNTIPFHPANFLWKSRVPSKVIVFTWLVAHKKVNTNDMLQLRRPFKAPCPDWCILCRGREETIDHLILHCPIILGLWHKLFYQVGMVWVQPRSICDMTVISFFVF